MIRLQELELVFGHTDVRTYGWTHRRDVGNSVLDFGGKELSHCIHVENIVKIGLNFK